MAWRGYQLPKMKRSQFRIFEPNSNRICQVDLKHHAPCTRMEYGSEEYSVRPETSLPAYSLVLERRCQLEVCRTPSSSCQEQERRGISPSSHDPDPRWPPPSGGDQRRVAETGACRSSKAAISPSFPSGETQNSRRPRDQHGSRNRRGKNGPPSRGSMGRTARTARARLPS